MSGVSAGRDRPCNRPAFGPFAVPRPEGAHLALPPGLESPLPKHRRPRKGKALPAVRRSARLYLYIDPSQVGLFRYLLEAEDNLGLMTVVDRRRAALMLRFSPHQERAARARLEEMREVVPFTLVELDAIRTDIPGKQIR